MIIRIKVCLKMLRKERIFACKCLCEYVRGLHTASVSVSVFVYVHLWFGQVLGIVDDIIWNWLYYV